MEITDVHIIQKTDIGYLERLLFDEHGELNILPYEELKDIPQVDITQLCVKHGMYCLPTMELIYFIRDELDGQEDKTIEIGSGNGVLGKALGVRSTDSYQQEKPEMRMLYEFMKQPTVKYGTHVEKYEALDAVRRFRPQNVVGAWVTHKYNPREHWREGNEEGIDEGKLLKKIDKYIFVGNSKVHNKKPIFSIPHREIKAEWIVSRSLSRELNVIWIWDAKGR